MEDNLKKLITKKINAYFVFVAFAFAVSAYVLLLDNSGSYQAEVDILVSPKSETMAVQIDKIKRNIIVLSGMWKILKDISKQFKKLRIISETILNIPMLIL